LWASSSAGRARRSQRRGRGFESHLVHHSIPFIFNYFRARIFGVPDTVPKARRSAPAFPRSNSRFALGRSSRNRPEYRPLLRVRPICRTSVAITWRKRCEQAPSKPAALNAAATIAQAGAAGQARAGVTPGRRESNPAAQSVRRKLQHSPISGRCEEETPTRWPRRSHAAKRTRIHEIPKTGIKIASN
jgi:hypothetical protein